MYYHEDNAAKALGAVAYHDDKVSRIIGGQQVNWHFARYYFGADGRELAYFIPDLRRYHPIGHLHVHEEPRVWGFSKNLQPLN